MSFIFTKSIFNGSSTDAPKARNIYSHIRGLCQAYPLYFTFKETPEQFTVTYRAAGPMATYRDYNLEGFQFLQNTAPFSIYEVQEIIEEMWQTIHKGCNQRRTWTPFPTDGKNFTKVLDFREPIDICRELSMLQSKIGRETSFEPIISFMNRLIVHGTNGYAIFIVLRDEYNKCK